MTTRLTGRKAGRVNKLLAAACAAGALLLIAAGLIDGAPNSKGEWMPLNEAVQASLNTMNGDGNPVEPAVLIVQTEHSQELPTGGGAGSASPEEGTRELDHQAFETVPSSTTVPVMTSRDELGRLDLNRATAEELLELKGIGPSKAQAITEDRERNGRFASVDDLIRVKGIGEKLLTGIKESVVARP
ncbi:ComEA family DNA-binding protein [Paenibacillus sp. 1011MAR3C5]|uniref:ComEA family DNA-binding protein n=1 Tax=Paenibacillus sp. 1011MAR3C5 TaxID=1675787 RepID=UPI001C71BD18|nr:ComEA family DNA-binding protein [Paenibacillus sp. 1011MAR3C5]